VPCGRLYLAAETRLSAATGLPLLCKGFVAPNLRFGSDALENGANLQRKPNPVFQGVAFEVWRGLGDWRETVSGNRIWNMKKKRARSIKNPATVRPADQHGSIFRTTHAHRKTPPYPPRRRDAHGPPHQRDGYAHKSHRANLAHVGL